jgi:hypothetical protein
MDTSLGSALGPAGAGRRIAGLRCRVDGKGHGPAIRGLIGTSSMAASMSIRVSRPPAEGRAAKMLLPIMAVVLTAFLVIGLAMPVLPLHVHQGLRLGTFMVGLVAGSQFAASLISRISAGDYADKKGAKRAVVLGLVATTLSGLFYLLSLGFLATPGVSATILVMGRAVLARRRA